MAPAPLLFGCQDICGVRAVLEREVSSACLSLEVAAPRTLGEDTPCETHFEEAGGRCGQRLDHSFLSLQRTLRSSATARERRSTVLRRALALRDAGYAMDANERQVEAAAGDGPSFDDLLFDDTLDDLERIGRYATSAIALQRLVHVRLVGETARAVGCVLRARAPARPRTRAPARCSRAVCASSPLTGAADPAPPFRACAAAPAQFRAIAGGYLPAA